MNKVSFQILRIGLAITFLWIGIFIFKQPEAWGGYLQSWAVALLPIPLSQAMVGAAVLDIMIGLFLLFDIFTWFVALVSAFHLIIILIVSGITDITVRDIGLLAATLSLMLYSLPQSVISRITFLKKLTA